MSAMVRAASVALALIAGACAGAAQPAPTVAPTPTAVASPTAASSASTGGPWTFSVDASSKTTIRVREVLAETRAPGDAVLTVTGMKGSFTLNTDGTFSASSKITADLATISSDSGIRDRFVRDTTLDVRRFPTAEFVPARAMGLALPLPASGDLTFRIEGKMTVHGTTKDVTFAVKAARTGTRLTATATAEPAWTFADFGLSIPRVSSVLSVEDEIRLEIALVATETRG